MNYHALHAAAILELLRKRLDLVAILDYLGGRRVERATIITTRLKLFNILISVMVIAGTQLNAPVLSR